MNALVVKVCGLTRAEDVIGCAAAGADLVGCIFAAKSPRHVTPAQAAALPRTAAKRVGVFVEQTVPEILAIMVNLSTALFKMERGQYVLSPTPVDIVPIIRKILSVHEETAQHHDLCLELTLDGRPLRCGEAFTILGEELLCYSMDNSIWVATMTGRWAWRQARMIFFWMMGSWGMGHSRPRSPRATMEIGDSAGDEQPAQQSENEDRRHPGRQGPQNVANHEIGPGGPHWQLQEADPGEA